MPIQGRSRDTQLSTKITDIRLRLSHRSHGEPQVRLRFDLWQAWLFGSPVFAWVVILLAKRLGEGAPGPRAGPCA